MIWHVVFFRARKAREKETKRVEETERESAAAAKKSSSAGPRKFGAKTAETGESSGQTPASRPVPKGPPVPSAGDELRAAMLRRRSAIQGDS